MENKIIQGSEEWKLARQEKIGASEIYTLVFHYCQDELKKLGLDVMKVTERPFRTIQELFLKIKFGAKLNEIDPMHSEFGNGMEGYIAYRLGQELPVYQLTLTNPFLDIERSKDFVINENLHPLAACSPDGYLKFNPIHNKHFIFKLPDFDKTCEIDHSWGDGVLELKTANYFANFGAEQGAKLQYIFQHQFQMMVTNLKWGIIAVLIPKEKEFDEPFFKGKVLQDVYLAECDKKDTQFATCYDLYHYTYPTLPVFQNMIIKALNAFQADLDAYDTDQSRFPRNSEDLVGLQREKAMWAQLWPEKFGKLELSNKDELDYMLNQRHEANVAAMFAEGEKKKLENEIIQRVGKYQEIIGTEHRLVWTKNGQVRFYKLK